MAHAQHKRRRRKGKQPRRWSLSASTAAGFNSPLPALPAILNDDQVLDFRQWCALNRISPRTGRRILDAPGGPVVTQLSANRIGISVKNNRAWQGSRERVSS
jgi:hypothetical protein